MRQRPQPAKLQLQRGHRAERLATTRSGHAATADQPASPAQRGVSATCTRPAPRRPQRPAAIDARAPPWLIVRESARCLAEQSLRISPCPPRPQPPRASLTGPPPRGSGWEARFVGAVQRGTTRMSGDAGQGRGRLRRWGCGFGLGNVSSCGWPIFCSPADAHCPRPLPGAAPKPRRSPPISRGVRTFIGDNWVSRERGIWEYHLQGDALSMG